MVVGVGDPIVVERLQGFDALLRKIPGILRAVEVRLVECVEVEGAGAEVRCAPREPRVLVGDEVESIRRGLVVGKDPVVRAGCVRANRVNGLRVQEHEEGAAVTLAVEPLRGGVYAGGGVEVVEQVVAVGCVMVGVEATGEAAPTAEPSAARRVDEGNGLVAGFLEDLADDPGVARDRALVPAVRDAHPVGMISGEHHDVGGQGAGSWRERVREDDRLFCESIEGGRGVPRVAVHAEMVGPECVDGDQQDVGPGFPAARQQARQPRGGQHPEHQLPTLLHRRHGRRALRIPSGIGNRPLPWIGRSVLHHVRLEDLAFTLPGSLVEAPIVS